MVVGAIVSIAAGWPAQFGGEGDPDAVASEFLTRGTALAPPLIPLLLFVLCAFGARRDDRLGTIATIGAVLLAVAFVIGSLGEAFAPETPDVPRAALLASGVIGALFSLAVIVTGLARLRELRLRP
jgi:hypothetical protein